MTAGAAQAPAGVGLMLALVGATLFSAKAVIVKLAYRHGVDAVTLIMLRMLFALPLFALLAWWAGRGRPALARRDWAVVAALGFCGYYLASLLDFLGLQWVSAGFERLVLYLNPTLVLLISALWLRQRVDARQLGALALSYAGIALVFGREARLSGDDAMLGSALVFGSALSYAVYLVASGQQVRRIGAMRLTGLATGVACLLCIAQFALLRPLSAARVVEEVLWLSLVNGVACTFVPVLLTMMAIERVGAPLAAQAGMVGPMATLALGWLLLGEQLDAWVLAGTALVLAGVALLARSPRPAGHNRSP